MTETQNELLTFFFKHLSRSYGKYKTFRDREHLHVQIWVL